MSGYFYALISRNCFRLAIYLLRPFLIELYSVNLMLKEYIPRRMSSVFFAKFK